MGYHPLFALARGVRKTVEYPYVVGGIALTAGYLGGALGRGVVRADERTRRLVRERQLRRIQGALGMGGRRPGPEDRSA